MAEVIFSVAQSPCFVWIHLPLKAACGSCLTELGKTQLWVFEICEEKHEVQMSRSSVASGVSIKWCVGGSGMY